MKKVAVTERSSSAEKSESSSPKSSDSPIRSQTIGLRRQKSRQPVDVDLVQTIRMEAYFRSEQRGFAAGLELQDWLEAEQAIKRATMRNDEQLTAG